MIVCMPSFLLLIARQTIARQTIARQTIARQTIARQTFTRLKKFFQLVG